MIKYCFQGQQGDPSLNHVEIWSLFMPDLRFYLDSTDQRARDRSLEDSFKPLQVGITNPTQVQQSAGLSPNSTLNRLPDGLQQATAVPVMVESHATPPGQRISPRILEASSSDEQTSSSSNRQQVSAQRIVEATPIVPAPVATSSSQIKEEGRSDHQKFLDNSFFVVPVSARNVTEPMVDSTSALGKLTLNCFSVVFSLSSSIFDKN